MLRFAAAWSWRLLLVVAAVWVLLQLFSLLSVVLVPVIIGLLLAAAASPIADRLQRLGPAARARHVIVVLTGIALIAALVDAGRPAVLLRLRRPARPVRPQPRQAGALPRRPRAEPRTSCRTSSTGSGTASGSGAGQPRRHGGARPPRPPATCSPGCSSCCSRPSSSPTTAAASGAGSSGCSPSRRATGSRAAASGPGPSSRPTSGRPWSSPPSTPSASRWSRWILGLPLVVPLGCPGLHRRVHPGRRCDHQRHRRGRRRPGLRGPGAGADHARPV